MKDFLDIVGDLSEYIKTEKHKEWMKGLNVGIENIKFWMKENNIPISIYKEDTIPQLFDDIDNHLKRKKDSGGGGFMP